ncbi:AAA family ATPase [Streptomyces sp. NPDC093252]|uniref:AAA family ATPase n=1 Tax=Streptomyces sp. NPDC093252 TaxID=3154980 RepID=UPI00342419E0
MRSAGPALPGRENILYAIRRALDDTLTGDGNCLIVEGPAGTGRTALLRAAVESARARGLTVASAEATPLDRSVPYGTLRALLRHSVPPALLAPLTASPGHDPLEQLHLTAEFLGRATRVTPLLVALDDAHHADGRSLLALRRLVRASSALPVLWLLAGSPVRPVDAQDPHAPLDPIDPIDPLGPLLQDGATRHTLDPLPPDAVAALCAEVLGARPDDGVLALAARCGGNPYLLKALLATSLADGRVRVMPGTGTAVLLDSTPAPAFRRAVEHQVRDLSGGSRRILDALAVLGPRFSVHEAAALLGRTPVELLPQISELIDAAVLAADGPAVVFRHELVRETLCDRLPEPVRTALHREAASVLRREGGPAARAIEQVPPGRHDADGPPIPSAPIPGPPTLGPSIPGPLPPTPSLPTPLPPGAEPPAPPPLDPLAARRAARTAPPAPRTDAPGRPPLAELMADAAHLMGATTPTASRATPTPTPVATPPTPRPYLVKDPRPGRPTEPVHRTTMWYSAARAQGLHDQVAAHAREALRAARDDDPAAAHHRLWLAVALTARDEFDQAAAILTGNHAPRDDDPRAHAAPLWVAPMWHFHRAELALAAGRLAEADAGAAEAVRTAGRLAVPALGVGPLALRARVALHTGDLALARRHLALAGPLSAGAAGAALEDLAWVTALLHRAADDEPRTAVDALSPVYAALPGRPLLLAKEPPAGAGLVRAALGAGDTGRAAAATEAARLAAARNPTVTSALAAVAHAEGVLRDDVDRLRTAVAHYRRGPRPLALAAAAEDLARAEEAHGGRPAALGLLKEALGRYQGLGADGDALRVRRTLHALGVRGVRNRNRDGDREPGAAVAGDRARWERLTPSELRVVRLVAQGLTNREVAGRLFLSRHTVDSHLRHSFTKLGVTGRVELTRRVLAHEREDDDDLPLDGTG